MTGQTKISDESASVILYPKKSTAFLILLICCIFVAIGIAMIISGETLGYLVGGFFGLGCGVVIVQLLPGSAYLSLDSEGFTYCSLFRKHTVAWSDVDEFFVITLKQTGAKVHEMVGYNFSASYDKGKLPRMLSSFVGKCEGGLPDSYGMKAEELVALMNSFLENQKSSD